MSNPCRELEQLSADGNWDDVFHCLKIDVNSTVELGGLRLLRNQDDSWLDNHKATTNSLEVILFIILLFDQIFYMALLWYMMLFSFKFLRYRGRDALRKFKLKLFPPKPDLRAQIAATKCDGEGLSHG